VIILVANVGGALTPLGDPPLFAGFLHGGWMQTGLWRPCLSLRSWRSIFDTTTAMICRDQQRRPHQSLCTAPLTLCSSPSSLRVFSFRGVIFDVYGTKVELQNLVRVASLVAIAALSLWGTPETHRKANDFSWEPMQEVAKLFAGIFVAIIPALSMLQAGRSGAFSWLLSMVSERDGSPHELHTFGSPASFQRSSITCRPILSSSNSGAATHKNL
jgi:Na+/H+ antiporter NhaD/arsenite permease-like protein